MMVHMPESVTVEELLKELNVNLKEVDDITVNNLRSEFGRILADGDHIGVFPPNEEIG
jgi:molybdopterin converting factor small subunit